MVRVYLRSNFPGGLRKTHVFWNRVHNGPSRWSKVVDFGVNRKRVCDFLLVINSNLGSILPRFRGTAGFQLRRVTPPLFHSNLALFALDCWCCGSDGRRSDGQADRQTDGCIVNCAIFDTIVNRTPVCLPTIPISRFALRASRGKNLNLRIDSCK